jgi:hypothetical protein
MQVSLAQPDMAQGSFAQMSLLQVRFSQIRTDLWMGSSSLSPGDNSLTESLHIYPVHEPFLLGVLLCPKYTGAFVAKRVRQIARSQLRRERAAGVGRAIRSQRAWHVLVLANG